MRKRNIFTDVMVKRFVRASRIPAVHPLIPPLLRLEQRESGEALKTLKDTGKPDAWTAAFVRTALFLVLAVFTPVAHGGVREIGTIGLTVGDLNRELAFYTNTLPFELSGVTEKGGSEEDQLLGLKGARLRVAELKLGLEHITLTEHLIDKGRSIPADSRSYDHWFQHVAIVVRDMDGAFARLRRHKVRQVSTGPQTLPEWNKNAAGIKAFYFRDPEDHVLEIIWFPPGKGDPKWQQPGTNLYLGIDHTAIVVADTDRSLAFYRDLLGLQLAGESENYGVEQEHLNQVFGARLRITALRAGHGPGIEFLEYLTPPGGRPLAADARANDLVFWNTHLVADDGPNLAAKLRQHGAKFVSKPGSARSQIVRDPDGHALEVDEIARTKNMKSSKQAQKDL